MDVKRSIDEDMPSMTNYDIAEIPELLDFVESLEYSGGAGDAAVPLDMKDSPNKSLPKNEQQRDQEMVDTAVAKTPATKNVPQDVPPVRQACDNVK